MNNNLYELKKFVYNLESGYFKGREIEILDKLIAVAQEMRDQYILLEEAMYSNDKIQLEKISQQTFIYKPIMVKNYYEGDYLERFGETRTSDLKSSGLLEMHNQFWRAYEVQKGNIFASMPVELANAEQIRKLELLGWDKVEVDVYEIKKCTLTKKDFTKYLEKNFKHSIVAVEVYSDSTMILNYNLK